MTLLLLLLLYMFIAAIISGFFVAYDMRKYEYNSSNVFSGIILGLAWPVSAPCAVCILSFRWIMEQTASMVCQFEREQVMLLGTYYSVDDIYEWETKHRYRYMIVMKVKETEQSYIFELVKLSAPLGDAPQMDSFFRNGSKRIIKKARGSHCLQKWEDGTFTFYPFRAGVPYMFYPCKAEDRE